MMESLARRSLDGERFDVVVIGGGINGVAIARECARGGKRTLLLEQNDFAAGTTSRSTRIIHGGLRYLEYGELGLVRECLRERQRMLRDYCHLVRPLKFLLAVRGNGRHSAMAVRAGLWVYGAMGGGRSNARQNGARQLEALLDSGHDWAVFDYDDAQCEFPERLVAEWLTEGLSAGVVTRNHTRVLRVLLRFGQVFGVIAQDLLTGDESRIEAEWIVNATGPWADQVCTESSIATEAPLVGGLRGSHLVLTRFLGAPDAAVYSEAADGRPFFVVPWNGQLLVGTTEVRDQEDPGRTEPSAREIEYLFASLTALFPAAGISWGDVQYAFAGVRPLPYAPQEAPSAVTRRHLLHDHSDNGAAGMISVIGGKLTTAASLARECVRRIGARVEEPSAMLLGQGPCSDDIGAALVQWSRQIAATAHISEQSARAIAEWHGRRAMAVARLAASDERLRAPLCRHSHHLVAEAVEAVQHELAATLGDILLRRVPVALSACWTEACSHEAATRIGTALGWDEIRRGGELDAFECERAQFLRKVVAPVIQGPVAKVRARS
jgi:glycerol-3-phosphate dehydrogenase